MRQQNSSLKWLRWKHYVQSSVKCSPTKQETVVCDVPDILRWARTRWRAYRYVIFKTDWIPFDLLENRQSGSTEDGTRVTSYAASLEKLVIVFKKLW